MHPPDGINYYSSKSRTVADNVHFRVSVLDNDTHTRLCVGKPALGPAQRTGNRRSTVVLYGGEADVSLRAFGG